MVAFLMEKLTDEQIEEFRDAFSSFDKDGNGYITTKELAAILRSLGLNPTEHELCSIINEVDFDGNGKIDFPEFVNMMVLQGDQMAWKEKDLKEAFRTFDSDDKGFMHAAELKYVLMRMDDPTVSDEDIKEMLDDTGLNINRKITFKEFKSMAKPEIKIKAPRSEDSCGMEKMMKLF